uniref:Uncharacterized protein isoform X2 n=1 Tax=Nicotiana tabacum TaxID=4097 RepID=A0A1S3ZPP7_TOBAC|nr:uncharacterized protein LOC104095220 isoform X2 [Nicotiana tomentosiformis]XP_016466332.1 PREDICTED: uncharacterized protein LOC107789073 isoform X2 [Nicotiana tabacum]
MKCLSLHSPILPKHSSSKYKCQHRKSKPAAHSLLEKQQYYYNAKLSCFPNHQPTGFLKGQKRSLLIAPLRAVDIPISSSSFFIAAANSPAAPRDLSVLLQTSNAFYVLDCQLCGAGDHLKGSSR